MGLNNVSFLEMLQGPSERANYKSPGGGKALEYPFPSSTREETMKAKPLKKSYNVCCCCFKMKNSELEEDVEGTELTQAGTDSAIIISYDFLVVISESFH